MISIERAEPHDRIEIESLLQVNGLPLDGLEPCMATAFVARDGATVVGCAAVEPYGSRGLLRSVCVAEEVRGTGLGRALVAATEELSSRLGVAELFLLTETAVDWFPRLGYERCVRDDAPADMAASPEFVSACPVSAAVMRKRLEVATPLS